MEDGSLCLTICDRYENKDTFRCKIEKCDRFPDAAECAEFKKCTIKRDCKGLKRFTDPTCCPPEICDPGCLNNNNQQVQEDLDCGPTEPPAKCTWGYKLGDVISELFVEPIQKQVIDEDGMVHFL